MNRLIRHGFMFCHPAPSAFPAPFPMGGREGRASALRMQGRLTVQLGSGEFAQEVRQIDFGGVGDTVVGESVASSILTAFAAFPVFQWHASKRVRDL